MDSFVPFFDVKKIKRVKAANGKSNGGEKPETESDKDLETTCRFNNSLKNYFHPPLDRCHFFLLISYRKSILKGVFKGPLESAEILKEKIS